MKSRIIVLAVLALIFVPCARAQTQAPTHVHYEKPEGYGKPNAEGRVAPRLQNLGDYKFPVTTESPEAQLFFNQGFNLAYGFNHAEAARAFEEAARLDPHLAMAHWGRALVLGPNINAPMDPANEPVAYRIIQEALALKEHASPREQAYIEALAKRYSDQEKPDRPALDRAYADAMREVSRRYPEDLDAATLFAEALMDLRPWNYWTRDGKPYPETAELVGVLESVIARDAHHPGALHLYIHAVESTKDPERAEAAADRLGSLMPGAGHMVHMPSHIYLRLGRYADASAANEKAIEADEDYITQCRAQGIYPLTYYPHNIHFLWASATMEGRSRKALAMARKTAQQISPEALKEVPLLEGFLVIPYYAMVRFGLWDDILREPDPAAAGPLVAGVRHHARGMALSAKDRPDEAKIELEELRKLAQDPEVAKLALWSGNSVADLLNIAVEVLAGEMAARAKDYDAAISRLDRAVRIQDGLIYTEPPDWHYPVRQSLGVVLLEAGRPAEAETVFWDDLRQNPENGWSLHGLMLAQLKQGKSAEADFTRTRFEKAWRNADVKLASPEN